MAFQPQVEDAIQRAAQRYGLSPETLRAFARIESGGNPGARTGGYHGLFQLSPQEFAKHGGQGNIYDTTANTEAAARKLRAESEAFAQKYGRQPTASELYLIHQQGEGGAAAHWSNPDRPAWQSMLSTGEGRQKGEGWARQAIWGNVPDDLKRQFGSVDNITSKQFTELWDKKVRGFGGQPPQPQPASSGPETVPETGLSPLALLGGSLGAPATPTSPPMAMAPSPTNPPAEPQTAASGPLASLQSLFPVDPKDGDLAGAALARAATADDQQPEQQQRPMALGRRVDASRMMAALAARAPLGLYRS